MSIVNTIKLPELTKSSELPVAVSESWTNWANISMSSNQVKLRYTPQAGEEMEFSARPVIITRKRVLPEGVKQSVKNPYPPRVTMGQETQIKIEAVVEKTSTDDPAFKVFYPVNMMLTIQDTPSDAITADVYAAMYDAMNNIVIHSITEDDGEVTVDYRFEEFTNGQLNLKDF